MDKFTVSILIFLFLDITSVFSQKIQFRFDIGNAIEFTSYREKLFQDYYQKPISTSEYTYTKLSTGSLFEVPFHFAFSLEYVDKRKNHFTISYLRDNYVVNDRVIFNYAYIDSSGIFEVTPWSSSSEIKSYLKKIRFEYAREFGKNWFRVSPFMGVSYAWINKSLLNTKDLVGHGEYNQDVLYQYAPFYIDRYMYVMHTNTFMGSIGFDVRIHSKKRELFSIKFFYEQGFRPFTMNQIVVVRNHKRFIYNVSYSYGSALYLKLSIPIPIYNFDKHRKK